MIEETLTTIPMKIQEVATDNKVSFSNTLMLNVQLLPVIESVDPRIIPAYETEQTFIVEVKGKNFIAGSTRVFVGDFYHADVNVLSATIGAFVAPRNVSPGIQPLKITNNKLKHPTDMANLRVLEFLKLPELHELLPSEVPTMDVP